MSDSTLNSPDHPYLAWVTGTTARLFITGVTVALLVAGGVMLW